MPDFKHGDKVMTPRGFGVYVASDPTDAAFSVVMVSLGDTICTFLHSDIRPAPVPTTAEAARYARIEELMTNLDGYFDLGWAIAEGSATTRPTSC